MSESGSNLRAFRFIWAWQSLETGDKGSHPLPVATMEITPSTSKWCWRRKVAFGWDCSLVSAVCRRGSVTVDRSALARHIEIWEFAHLVFATTQSQVLSLGHTLLSKIMFASLWSCSQWENVLRSCGGRGIVLTLVHWGDWQEEQRREDASAEQWLYGPCTSLTWWMTVGPSLCVKSLGPLQRTSINRNQKCPQE